MFSLKGHVLKSFITNITWHARIGSWVKITSHSYAKFQTTFYGVNSAFLTRKQYISKKLLQLGRKTQLPDPLITKSWELKFCNLHGLSLYKLSYNISMSRYFVVWRNTKMKSYSDCYSVYQREIMNMRVYH